MPAESPSPPATAEVVLTFLESVGRRSEAELYLELFRHLPRESFAIIAAEAQVVKYATGSLVEQLRVLSELSLYAPVVVGLFVPEGAAERAARLGERLAGVGLTSPVHDAAEPDLVDRLRQELRAGAFPVVAFPPAAGEDLDQRFSRLGAVAGGLGTRKLVVLRRRGALGKNGLRRHELSPGHVLPTHGGRISLVNLQTDYDLLAASRLLERDDLVLLERLRALLAAPESKGMLASVAAPLGLLTELFTVRGAGTLVKSGSVIRRHACYDGLDIERLRALLETTFGRSLLPGFFERPLLALYLEEGYRGAALIEAAEPAPYLSKFAVDPVAQGEGMGRDLWQAIVRDHPSFFWRSRPENPIAGWYTGLCDGMLRRPRWQIFWRGIAADGIARVVEGAEGRAADFEG